MNDASSSRHALPGRSHEAAVTMHRTTEGFLVPVPGFEDVELDEDDISKSTFLQKFCDASEVGDELPLGMDGMVLRDWSLYVSKGDTDQWTDIQTLLRVLQVSSSSLSGMFGSWFAEGHPKWNRIHVQMLHLHT